MKNNKKKIFSIYIAISFFALVIFFFLYDNKSITTYQIKNSSKPVILRLNFFESLFKFKIESPKPNNAELHDFYSDVTLNYFHNDYSNSTNLIVNYYELFNKHLNNQLKINSINGETFLKRYSHKNIPKRNYEVQIISKNPEDAQKFFEKHISQTIEIVNNELLEMIYYDYLTRNIKKQLTNKEDIEISIKILKECKTLIQDKNFQYLFNIDSRLLDKCNYLNNLTLVEDKIAQLEKESNIQQSKILESKNFKFKSVQFGDYLYKSFIEINEIKNTENTSYLNVFILYLLSLILVWIFVFKTNYFTLLFNKKLFKFPK